ncbi:hypothetical protein GP486_003387 [Trichoglossum hirsutum]|uniref:Uncharacterized protein n=1 Tax=Trichoglossum hirsutum TaxID=265104 RepID=A0A9P8LD58_9PEZI|nr:hypothetical protein GP486_003387 [Trichoglossum hirsutum]
MSTPSPANIDPEERPHKRCRLSGSYGEVRICYDGTSEIEGGWQYLSSTTPSSGAFAEAQIRQGRLGPQQVFSLLWNGKFTAPNPGYATCSDPRKISHLQVALVECSVFKAGVQIPVIFDRDSGTLLSQEDDIQLGIPEENGLQILRGLSDEHSIDIQLLCTIELNRQALGIKAKKSKISGPAAHLSTIIYGPFGLFEDVGKFVEGYDMYLQDPRGCNRNVKYRNPHRLSGLDADAPMTLELSQFTVSYEEAPSMVGLLADFESDEFLAETEAPPALRTDLYSPQQDLWSVEMSPSGSRIYTNNITQDTQSDAPLQFRGGILADHMGLGKTLSMISLIAHDFPERSQCGQGPTITSPAHRPETHQSLHIPPASIFACTSEQRNGVCRPRQLIKTTLLIVPSSLLPSWESQLTRHLHPGILRWTKHHGSYKLHNPSQLHQFDVVISSFQTVSSEYRRQAITPSFLFSAPWHRVVLDEAHCIRNRNTITTKAVCAIQATSRWAMTGTPLQNRLTDFASLLQFLRVFPYTDHKVFESHITDVWKTQGHEAAIERLKKLVKYLTLRRSQVAINLPERANVVAYLDFSREELKNYRQAESPIADMLDDALNTEDRHSGTYMHALAKINTLRRLCNLSLTTQSLKIDLQSKLLDPSVLTWNGVTAQEAYENLVSLGQTSCMQCYTDLDIPSQKGLTPLEDCPRVRLTQCLRLICETCFQQTTEYPSASICICEDRESCSAAIISADYVTSSPATPVPEYAIEQDRLSTKIKALCADIQSTCSEKSVVFSSWTTTLDQIQSALGNASVQCVRVDGRVSARNRAIAFDAFRTDPTVRVILLTISCGAEGLDLTAASRVYLMEPQWNPTIEEQALARVHRLGQKNKVTATRFIMKGSIEDHVINVQDRKKQLADLLLSSQGLSQSDLNRSRLQHLRSLLG